MQESEVKKVKPRQDQKIQNDPNLKGGARGGDKEAAEPPPENEEAPIIQRYSE